MITSIPRVGFSSRIMRRLAASFDPTLFADESANNLAITRNGTPIRTTASPFASGKSATFNGATDSLQIANSNALDLTSAFTLEAFFNISSNSDACIYSRGGGSATWLSSNGLAALLLVQSNVIYTQWQITGNNVGSFSAAAPTVNTWNHLVLGFNGTTLRGWLNGSSLGTSTSLPVNPTTRNLVYAGKAAGGSSLLPGKLSQIRQVSADVYGVGNATITVPTSPLTAIANTQLLLGFNLP